MNEQSIREVFRENLNNYMLAKHITPKQICDYIGVTKTTVSEWQLGKKMPRMDKIEQLCNIFNCSRSDLLEKKEPPETSGRNYAWMDDLTPEEEKSVKVFVELLRSKRNQ